MVVVMFQVRMFGMVKLVEVVVLLLVVELLQQKLLSFRKILHY